MKATNAILCAMCSVLLLGCAGTPMKIDPLKLPPNGARIDSNDIFSVIINSRPEIVVADSDKERIKRVVSEKISSKAASAPSNEAKRKYEVKLDLATYDKGNSFARFMLAGLGAIKIKSQIQLVDTESAQKISEFDAGKTFAWGGYYGASMRMEDIELTFAESVAAALTGTTAESTGK